MNCSEIDKFANRNLKNAFEFKAEVAELVDALDSKSSTFGCAGSIPAFGTKRNMLIVNILRLFFL